MASGDNAIRGTRVGAGPAKYSDHAEPVARRHATYWCANGHETRPSFAVDAVPPETWDCPRCGLPAGQDPDNPPDRPRTELYKTHLAYVKERRTEAEGAAILAEALAKLRAKKGR